MKKRFTSVLSALLCAAVALGLCACGSGGGLEESASALGEEAVSSGQAVAADGEKEIVVAIYKDGAMEELDAATYNGPHFLFKMIYEGFVEDNGDGTLEPVLATQWDISEDGKTYTYHLREGVKFSDGTDFNAGAVAFNLKRWMNNDRFSSLTSYAVDNIEIIDDYTIAVTYTDAAYAILLEQTYPRPNRFLSPSSIENDGSTTGVFSTPVGTGPWMLESYVKDEEFTLVPNPYYWGEKPQVDRIRFKVITDAQARLLALKSGEVDIIGGDLMGKIPMESLNELRNSGEFDTYVTGTMCSHFISFNEDNEIFQDKNVRQALNYAVNKKSIAEDLYDGNGLEAHGMYQDSVPYVTSENSYAYPYDTARAIELLETSGWMDSDGDGIREKGGQKLSFTFVYSVDEFPEWKSLAEYLQAAYSEIGVQIQLSCLDKNGYADATTSKNFDICLRRTASDSWVPHSSLKELFYPYADRDYALVWTDENLQSMINDALLCLNEDERQEKYDAVFSCICEEAYSVPVYYPTTSFAVNGNKVDGFEVGVNNYAPVAWEKLNVK